MPSLPVIWPPFFSLWPTRPPQSLTNRLFAVQARDCLKTAFEAGKGRSDFVALFAWAQTAWEILPRPLRCSTPAVRVTVGKVLTKCTTFSNKPILRWVRHT